MPDRAALARLVPGVVLAALLGTAAFLIADLPWVRNTTHASALLVVPSVWRTFDFEGMDKVPQVLEPLLFYVLHRANASIYDPAQTTTFKAFVMDEAWRFLRHPTIQRYILEALKTWRKKNAAMILATQSSDDRPSAQPSTPP